MGRFQLMQRSVLYLRSAPTLSHLVHECQYAEAYESLNRIPTATRIEADDIAPEGRVVQSTSHYEYLNRVWPDAFTAGQQGSVTWLGGVRHIRQHTKHKVILTTPIERLGQAGQIVKVAPGFARNCLMPNKLALPAIEKFVLLVQNQLKQMGTAHVEEVIETPKTQQEIEAEKLKAVDVVLRRLAKGRVVLRRDVGMKTTLLKLVTKPDVLYEVQRQLGVELQGENLVMESDFSQLGDFDVLLRLPEGLKLPGDKAKLFLKLRIRRK